MTMKPPIIAGKQRDSDGNRHQLSKQQRGFSTLSMQRGHRGDCPDQKNHSFGRSHGGEDVDHGGNEDQASDLEHSADEE